MRMLGLLMDFVDELVLILRRLHSARKAFIIFYDEISQRGSNELVRRLSEKNCEDSSLTTITDQAPLVSSINTAPIRAKRPLDDSFEIVCDKYEKEQSVLIGNNLQPIRYDGLPESCAPSLVQIQPNWCH